MPMTFLYAKSKINVTGAYQMSRVLMTITFLCLATKSSSVCKMNKTTTNKKKCTMINNSLYIFLTTFYLTIVGKGYSLTFSGCWEMRC